MGEVFLGTSTAVRTLLNPLAFLWKKEAKLRIRFQGKKMVESGMYFMSENY